MRLASLQLDFDLVILSLTVFFSGGLASPIIAMIIVYIMISTFLVDYHKALRYTLAAMVLILVIAVLQEGRGFFSRPAGHEPAGLSFHVHLHLLRFRLPLQEPAPQRGAAARRCCSQTRELSVTDGLTGLYNQMHFFELLDRETKNSQRHDLSYTLIIFDVDHFKNFNDSNGHLRGSETLKGIAAVMKRKFRSTDLLAKYGGDEFVIILPQTDKVGAYLAAERLRESR